ncbi:MAG: 2-phospho-L-lactate transferase [Hyphomicrobiaceae bacterium]
MSGGVEMRVVALSGGIGGAKLALGLSRILAPGYLTIIANTGDDFEHLGLEISPDIDTLMYTLAGLANPEVGWGRRDETWSFMQTLRGLGGVDWFNLGDRDLAVHVERTRRLKRGERLTAITTDFCTSLGIASKVLPMSDDPVRTVVKTPAGALAFQDYFVRLRCEPVVEGITFAGSETARLTPEVRDSLTRSDLAAIVICPSNPLISIDPILAVPGMRDALTAASAPVIAVSPIIAGRSVKGPTAKMMAELGIDVSAAAVARRYAELIDAFMAEPEDAEVLTHNASQYSVHAAKTLMTSLEDRDALARAVLDIAEHVGVGGQQDRRERAR